MHYPDPAAIFQKLKTTKTTKTTEATNPTILGFFAAAEQEISEELITGTPSVLLVA